MATIRDVAETAGVSIQTVSNVVHGKASVRPEVHERVMQAISLHHYQPSRAAQNMRRGQAQALGFIVSDSNPRGLADPFYGEVLTGLAEVAREHRYDVLIEWLPSNKPAQAADILSPFLSRRIDGAVIFLQGQQACSAELANELKAAQALFVMLECDVIGNAGNSVTAANRDGAFAATQYLLAHGHTRIAFLDSVQRWPAVDARRQGYEDAMHLAGCGACIQTVSSKDWTREGGAAAIATLLNSAADRPSAIVAATDLLAIGAIQVIKSRGLRVPNDIAVTGFDDFDFAGFVEPALTTVRLPAHDMGRRAAEVLLACLGGGHSDQKHIVLPTELIVRQSA